MLKKISIPYAKIALAPTDAAYLAGDERLQAFYNYAPRWANFKPLIEERQFSKAQRKVLVETLRAEYASRKEAAAVAANIEALGDARTFCITTAHQPNLFTGPLYFFYKIFSAINLAEQLRKRYPDYRFVPVYWMGATDHDFEELNHFRLFGKTLRWEDEQGGSIGAYQTESLAPVLEELKTILGDSEDGKATYALVEDAFAETSIYAEAMARLVHRLFAPYGLVIVSDSSPAYKKAAIPLFEKELFERPSKALVEETVAQLEALGFKNQAHPREVNLFYLRPNRRDRIVWEEGRFAVLNSDVRFSPEEMRSELQAHPERFSPNVVIRPLYQELLLPNLAYVGGGGELAYWLERKSQFAHFGIPFPMLIRRCSVLWVDQIDAKRARKFNFAVSDLFQEEEQLIKQYLHGQSEAELSLEEEIQDWQVVFERIEQKAIEVQESLGRAVAAERSKQEKNLRQLESRLLRAEKKKNETALKQIRKLKAKLFPEGDLQERKDNFLAFYLRYGQSFLDALKQHLQPMEQTFTVIWEESEE